MKVQFLTKFGSLLILVIDCCSSGFLIDFEVWLLHVKVGEVDVSCDWISLCCAIDLLLFSLQFFYYMLYMAF